jgi:hypothetical protein
LVTAATRQKQRWGQPLDLLEGFFSLTLVVNPGKTLLFGIVLTYPLQAYL